MESPQSFNRNNKEATAAAGLQQLREVDGKLQARLSLLNLKEHHPEMGVDIDYEHPESNTSEVRGQAMQEWVGDGSAELYGDYRDLHSEDPVNLGDAEEIRKILDVVLKRKDTLH